MQEASGNSRTTETDATGHSHFGGLAIAAAKTGSNNSSDIESSSVLLVYRDLQKSLWNVEGVLNVLQIIGIFPIWGPSHPAVTRCKTPYSGCLTLWNPDYLSSMPTFDG